MMKRTFWVDTLKMYRILFNLFILNKTVIKKDKVIRAFKKPFKSETDPVEVEVKTNVKFYTESLLGFTISKKISIPGIRDHSNLT